MKIKDVAEVLDVSELTVRRAINSGELEAIKENGVYEIQQHQLLKFIEENKKYKQTKESLVKLISQEFSDNSTLDTDLSVEGLQAKIIRNTITNYGNDLVEAFDSFLESRGTEVLLSNKFRSVENKLNVVKQPTVDEIERILSDVISVDCHENINIGERVSADKIMETFGRKPQQEGINWCAKSKELFVITKIGADNPTLERAEYNDFWKGGKIYYEGKGQGEFQEFKSSNLHLYRKYQVFQQLIKCKKDVPPYIHVFNRVEIYEREKFQYLGKFHVTDFFIDEQSEGRLQETKTAIVFELTPIVNNSSSSIDDNYIFN